jgi:hypothetical protein
LSYIPWLEVAEIVVHEGYEPNALTDLYDAESLTRQHARDVDPLAVQAGRWPRLSEQIFRIDKWSVCRGQAAMRFGIGLK